MSTITINGKSIHAPAGASISMVNGELYINGKKHTGAEMKAKEITITIDGDAGDVRIEAGVLTIKGAVGGSVQSVNGNVEIGGDVNGDIETVNGNVSCGKVGGRISSLNGNIRHA